MARCRLRTWLRGHLPGPFSRLFPKGRRDCGAHEWYRSTQEVDRCYHCTVGERPHEPIELEGELVGHRPLEIGR
jgi:hypothetical protein